MAGMISGAVDTAEIRAEIDRGQNEIHGYPENIGDAVEDLRALCDEVDRLRLGAATIATLQAAVHAVRALANRFGANAAEWRANVGSPNCIGIGPRECAAMAQAWSSAAADVRATLAACDAANHPASPERCPACRSRAEGACVGFANRSGNPKG